jgi:tetratricopeptide (TPR) repeat protein
MNRKQRRVQNRSVAPPPKKAAAALRAQFDEAMLERKAGRLDAAERLYRRVLASDPGLAEAHYDLGTVLRGLGRAEEALHACRRCIELRPHSADAHNSLGAALKQLGRTEEALAAYREAVALSPDFAEVHYNLGIALSELGRPQEAEQAFRRAIALQPDFAYAHNNLGVVLQEQGRLAESVLACRRAIELMPDCASAYSNMGTALKEAGLNEEALALYDRAASFRTPGFESPLGHKAQLLMELGRETEAAAVVEQALAVNPRSGTAWLLRSELKRFAAGDPEIQAMEDLLASAQAGAMRGSDRVNLEFALGKAWLDAGDAQRAFAHFDEGNRRKRATISYDASSASQRMAAIAQAFTPALLEHFRGAGDPSSQPVFVVGMPRSGTSLVEQILASHPQVHGAGELPLVQDLVDGSLAAALRPGAYPEALADLAAPELSRLGRAYAEHAAALSQGRRHVVDKMPTNFQHAGLIHLMLPNARIIHCRRDPVDTCLSCYTKNFRSGLRFCFDQRELGTLYRDYQALMQHWRGLLPPERFLEVEYEDIVADLEREARRLIAFCGLEWDERCLSFHATRRQVRTVSTNQVRRPIYRGSVGRWRPYAAYLSPLLAALQISP